MKLNSGIMFSISSQCFCIIALLRPNGDILILFCIFFIPIIAIFYHKMSYILIALAGTPVHCIDMTPHCQKATAFPTKITHGRKGENLVVGPGPCFTKNLTNRYRSSVHLTLRYVYDLS